MPDDGCRAACRRCETQALRKKLEPRRPKVSRQLPLILHEESPLLSSKRWIVAATGIATKAPMSLEQRAADERGDDREARRNLHGVLHDAGIYEIVLKVAIDDIEDQRSRTPIATPFESEKRPVADRDPADCRPDHRNEIEQSDKEC